MAPRTQRGNIFYGFSPSSSSMQLKSFEDEPYDANVDEENSDDYRYEASRLRSFEKWPVAYVKPEKLAAAGFYYTGELDIVRCFECGTETYKWEIGDEPMVDHKRQSPGCNFVRNFSCNTIAVDSISDILTDVSIAPPVLEDRDVCGPYKYAPPFDHCHFDPTDLSPSRRPKYPEYTHCETRLRSFDCWPTHLTQNPIDMSLAGFYYTGTEDQVLCFHCGVGVKDWESEDEPWEHHAIWYPSCNYLLEVKGSRYVKEATGRTTVPSEDTAPCVAKKEQSVYSAESKMKHIRLTVENCLPGPSSRGSDYVAVESVPSNNSLIKDLEKNLPDTQLEPSGPIGDTRMCKICYDAEISQLFLPCSHLVTCADCAKCIKTCPMCRGLVTGQMKVFFS